MSFMTSESLVHSLRHQISVCEAQLDDLRRQLVVAEAKVSTEPRPQPFLNGVLTDGVPDHFMDEIFSALAQSDPPLEKWPLRAEEYLRYGRQLIMPEIGLEGQLRLKSSSVLIVGVGGLGCPAAAYLAGAGVGTIGLIDGDVVDTSNLHRQILHSSAKVGMSKVQSALLNLQGLNPLVHYVPHEQRLEPEFCLDIFRRYDLVLDCTDTPASRYLISDACVILGKPLVSASALRTEGQLMVLNSPPKPPGCATGGPCYRCVFPKAPPAESVVTCGEGGILGPVVGVMGVLQALEAIKLIAPKPSEGHDVDTPMDLDELLSQTESGADKQTTDPPSLLLFSAYSKPPFRSIRLRSRRPKCAACSSEATVKAESLISGSLDYIQFCGLAHPVDALSPTERLSAREYQDILYGTPMSGTEDGSFAYSDHVLVDVREKVQFDLCRLDNSINIPFSQICATTDTNSIHSGGASWVETLRSIPPEKSIYVVCRLGNDSQLAVQKMKELKLDRNGRRPVKDIAGGLHSWRLNVDPEFPEY